MQEHNIHAISPDQNIKGIFIMQILPFNRFFYQTCQKINQV